MTSALQFFPLMSSPVILELGFRVPTWGKEPLEEEKPVELS